MQIVIDIPEELYKEYVSVTLGRGHGKSIVYNLLYAIKNSRPLPKVHGRLIDAEVLCDYFWNNRSKLYTHKDLRIAIDKAPTIIEADGGGQYAVSD